MSVKSMKKYFFRSSAQDFNKIDGSPVAYWITDITRSTFRQGESLGSIAPIKVGLQTGFNDLFLRYWFEVNLTNIGFDMSKSEDAIKSYKAWFPYNKGGDWRKWYGNCEYVVNWKNDGEKIRGFKDKYGKLRSRPQNRVYYFKKGITWGDITTSSFAARFTPKGFLFDVKGSSSFPEDDKIIPILGLLNSRLMKGFMDILNPTSTFQVGDMARVPYVDLRNKLQLIDQNVKQFIDVAKTDWDSYETSWDFTTLPLLQPNYRQTTLAATYQSLRAHWQENTLEMQRLEEENNRIFIEAYGLEDELTPEVPLEEITLTCNPHYRYRYRLGKTWDDKSEQERTTELETRLQQDTMQEFISYAVGCMFGRYSLDKEGLVLANQGETLEDYLAQVPNPSFMPDEDNVIPMLDGDWFTDDVMERFKEFLKITFGEEHYETNLAFIEKALNVKGTRNYSIRDYFLKEFYNDHVRTYKKRPIYWLFSSPKGSFNALVYMHRYRPDTVSVVLNGYLREYQTKLKSHKQNLEAISIGGGSQTEKTRALKEIERINKVLHELEEYEREVVYPLATEQVSIDLDDGVKQNYPKLGKALKKITGL